MGFKSRDLTVKLSASGHGECGGHTANKPDCGACTPTRPGDCGKCTVTDINCTATGGSAQSTYVPGELASLELLRQQLQGALAEAG